MFCRLLNTNKSDTNDWIRYLLLGSIELNKNDEHTYVFDFADGLAGAVFLGDGGGARTAEDHEIQQGVGAETVGTVNRRACGLATRVEPRYDDVTAAIFLDLDHLVRENRDMLIIIIIIIIMIIIRDLGR